MSIEAVLLAVVAVVRPTTIAAVLAMLALPQPRRLLVSYLGAGMPFSIGMGVLVVLVLDGASLPDREPDTRPIMNIVLGACSLACALGTASGLLLRPDPTTPRPDGGWIHGRLQNLSPRNAAVVGIVTHLPGLVYVAALNAIAGSSSGPTGLLLQVVLYNAVWFVLAEVALVLAVYRPGAPQNLLERPLAVARRHRPTIVAVSFGALGAYLVLNGTIELLTART
jgi:hypothetical protein